MALPARRIVSIQEGRLHVPGHGFLAGTRVSLPQLSDDIFIVCCEEEDFFSLEHIVRVPVASIDPTAGAVTTAVPHGMKRRWDHDHPRVMLADFKGNASEEVNGSSFVILDMSESVLYLGRYDHTARKHVPISLPGLAASLQEGTVVGEPMSAKLPKRSPGFGGIVKLALQPGPSRAECLQEFRAALEAAYNGRAPLEPVVAVIPEAACTGDVVVSYCLGKRDGIYEQRTPTLYCKGVLRLVFVEGLGVAADHGGRGVWCLLADLHPTYPLDVQRLYYNLKERWEGPQLLYVCRDSTPVSNRWEPVLGSYPGPVVRPSRAKPTLVCAATAPFPSSGQLVGAPEVNRLVLDFAFNVAAAGWRGHARRSPQGHTCLEIALLLASIYKDLCSASAVCRSWHAALLHVRLSSAVRSVLQVTESHESVTVATPEEFLGLCLRHHKRSVCDGLAITHDPVFARCAWGVSIDELELSAPSSGWRPVAGNDWTGEPVGEMLRELAPAFFVFARELLPDALLPWDKHLHRHGSTRHGDGTETITTSLLDDLFGSAGPGGEAHVLARCSETNGLAELLTFAGEVLTSGARLRPALRVLEDRLARTSSRWRVRLTQHSHGWVSSRHKPRDGPCELCKLLTVARTTPCRRCQVRHGWGTLNAQEKLRFEVIGEAPVPYVELHIAGMCVPFFGTTDDADRDTHLLHEVLGIDEAESCLWTGTPSDEDDADLATLEGDENAEDGAEEGELLADEGESAGDEE